MTDVKSGSCKRAKDLACNRKNLKFQWRQDLLIGKTPYDDVQWKPNMLQNEIKALLTIFTTNM